MRGLTKEEAAALLQLTGPDEEFIEGEITETDLSLLECGRIRHETPPPEWEWQLTLTPLGKLALRVHQICVERGLA